MKLLLERSFSQGTLHTRVSVSVRIRHDSTVMYVMSLLLFSPSDVTAGHSNGNYHLMIWAVSWCLVIPYRTRMTRHGVTTSLVESNFNVRYCTVLYCIPMASWLAKQNNPFSIIFNIISCLMSDHVSCHPTFHITHTHHVLMMPVASQ